MPRRSLSVGIGQLLPGKQSLDDIEPVAEIIHVSLQLQQMGDHQFPDCSTGIESRCDDILEPHPGFIVHIRQLLAPAGKLLADSIVVNAQLISFDDVRSRLSDGEHRKNRTVEQTLACIVHRLASLSSHSVDLTIVEPTRKAR
jgi:hypothetical protein